MYQIRYTQEILLVVDGIFEKYEDYDNTFSPVAYSLRKFTSNIVLFPFALYEIVMHTRKSLLYKKSRQVIIDYYGLVEAD